MNRRAVEKIPIQLSQLKYVWEEPPRYQWHFHIVHDAYSRLRSKELDQVLPILKDALKTKTHLECSDQGNDTIFWMPKDLHIMGSAYNNDHKAFVLHVSWHPPRPDSPASDLHMFPYSWSKQQVEELLKSLGISDVDA